MSDYAVHMVDRGPHPVKVIQAIQDASGLEAGPAKVIVYDTPNDVFHTDSPQQARDVMDLLTQAGANAYYYARYEIQAKRWWEFWK
tara:strand:+ start:250 stop:507 length:258 start_codon:yes stop_codon:yes gene_type:complete